MNSLEMCAGAGGQALGLERAGFEHEALVEWEAPACSTLRLNRPHGNVIGRVLNQAGFRATRIESSRGVLDVSSKNTLGSAIKNA